MGAEDSYWYSFSGSDDLLDRLHIPAWSSLRNCEGDEGLSRAKREPDTYPDTNGVCQPQQRLLFLSHY